MISVSLSGSLVILIAFTSTNTQTVTMIVSNPSLPLYNDLYTRHSNTLVCACSNSTMPYKNFVTLSSTFHQICSSDLVSDEWVSLLVQTFAGYAADFIWIYRAKKYFELMAALCNFANETASYSINNFLAQTFATTYVVPKTDFDTQLTTTVNQFSESVVTSFSLFIDTFRLMIQVDQPLPVLSGG